ncbi:MAG TPA: hypothetical protein VF771_07885 [Longimicrobiaceae bacterium]
MLRWLMENLRRSGEARRARKAGMLYPESLTVVTCDEAGIRGEAPGSEPWSIAWPELVRVEIHTTDQGPWAADVFWVLYTASAVHAVPQGATGERELLERLQQLPGFDNEAVIAAMTSTDNQAWTCWERGG